MEVTMAVLSDEDVGARLGDLDGWERDGDAIARQFQFKDFVGSVDFVNRITPLAEEMNHHPDLAISWNKVTVTLSTHSEGGLTENDFELASKIDGVAG
jgi:4a-hydroxytetrahydrobiopterin dehydratase